MATQPDDLDQHPKIAVAWGVLKKWRGDRQREDLQLQLQRTIVEKVVVS